MSAQLADATTHEKPPGLRFRCLTPLLGALIFLLAMRVVVRELRSFHYHEVAAYLDLLPDSRIAVAILGAFGSYFALMLVDLLAVRGAASGAAGSQPAGIDHRRAESPPLHMLSSHRRSV